MIQSSKLLSSYLKCLSSWPEDSDDTIKSIPSPYQIAKKINISANSSYKMWKNIFQNGYVKDIVLIPEVLPGNISRFYLRAESPIDDVRSFNESLSKIPGVEYVTASNYMLLRKGNSTVRQYKEVVGIQFISESHKVDEEIWQITNAFEDKGVEFIPLNFFENPRKDVTLNQTQARLMAHLCYRSIKSFSTEEITQSTNLSRKKARKVMDSLVAGRFVVSKPIYNFKKIPLMISRQLNISLQETESQAIAKWLLSTNEIKNNYLDIYIYPKGISLTVIGDTREEIDNIASFVSSHFDEVFISDHFDTHFNYDVNNYFSSYTKPETQKQ